MSENPQTGTIPGLVCRKFDLGLTDKRDQRVLEGIFNGDPDLRGYGVQYLTLVQVWGGSTWQKMACSYPQMLCVLNGNAKFELIPRTGNSQTVDMGTNELLLIPPGVGYSVNTVLGTELLDSRGKFFAPNNPTPAQPNVREQATHCRTEARTTESQTASFTAVTIYEPQSSKGYSAKQLKMLYVLQNDFLGRQGHFHHHPELYYVHVGEVIFDLWDRQSTKTRIVLFPGDTLRVPAYVAHRAYAIAGTMMLGSSGEPYTKNPPSDITADFAPVGGLPYGLT